MKKSSMKFLFLLSLLLLPIGVFAERVSGTYHISGIVFFEFCFTLIAVFCYINPITKALSNEKNKVMVFIALFIGRIVMLVILNNIYDDFGGVLVDFILVVFGKNIANLIKCINGREKDSFNTIPTMSIIPIKPLTDADKTLKCPNCSAPVEEKYKFCQACGKEVNIETIKQTITRVPANYDSFDPMYKQSEDKMLEMLINKELKKEGLDSLKGVATKDIRIKKIITNTIMSLLVFVYIILFFFHFPKITYVLGAIILIIVCMLSRKVSFIKSITKEIKARPSEKISNIIMSKKENLVKDYSNILGIVTLTIAIILPLIMFKEPVIIYEKMDNGYGVRFYAYGLKNNKTATIPETHNGKKVVSLRGNAFSNMYSLESVALPDSITEIRGQSFLNDKNLKKVKLPKNLKILGGSAFKNCTSLAKVELPDTITEIGGGAFYNASSLKSIKLPKKLKRLGGESFYGATSLEKVELPEGLTEIRGSTFEKCSSLKEINIPNNVTRIGGHAFQYDRSLTTVTVSENSKLREIGSSAFRNCNSLKEITLPKEISINERAFKESPTEIRYYGQEDNFKVEY